MSNLFTAVSVEQQAIVSGGVGLVLAPNLTLNEEATFGGLVTGFESQTGAGPTGAGTTTKYGFQYIGTNAKKQATQNVIGFIG